MNESLDDLIALLTAEVERLKIDLETFRLSSHPNRARLVRELVDAIDERQDRLEELAALQDSTAPTPSAPPGPEIH
jgi:acyl-CoA reductase-like NAD-dependent aldehyde dehydrogenase